MNVQNMLIKSCPTGLVSYNSRVNSESRMTKANPDILYQFCELTQEHQTII